MGWVRTALRSDVVARSLKVSLAIGTILVAINQGDVLLAGRWLAEFWWKIPLTYLVPYCVATYAAVQAIRHQ